MRLRLLPALLALELASALAQAAEVRVTARETVQLDFPGAVAAFAVDPSTAEVSLADGRLQVRGRRAGQTMVSVVMPTGVETLTILVDPSLSFLAAQHAAGARNATIADVSYDTGLRRFSTGVSANFEDGERKARLRLEAVRQDRPEYAGRTWSLPYASVAIETPRSRLVLLDEFVQASPLTIDGATVRGVHLYQSPFELHAGTVSRSPLDDVLFAQNGDRVASAAWRTKTGSLTLTPRAVWLPDSGTKIPGVIALEAARGEADDALQIRGELAWSHRFAAAVDIDYRTVQRQAWLKAALRPAGFAALSMARTAGSYAEGAWNEQLSDRASVTLSGSASRLDVGGRHPQAASGRIDMRYQATQSLGFNAAASAGSFRDAAQSLRRTTLSLGTIYEQPNWSAAATYRFQRTSAAQRGGHGGRVSLRASQGGWRANVFADAQQQAPTIDLVLRDRADLSRAATELGLASATPDDLIRQLRGNSALLTARGVTLGALNLSPMRVQAGLDLSWRAAAGKPEFGVRVVGDRAEAVASGRTSFVASAFAKWQIGRDTEMSVTYSRWNARLPVTGSESRGSVLLTLRTTFGAPSWPGSGSRPISGVVMRDGDAADAPLQGVDVVLDRGRRTQTDAQGRFVFESPGPGAHRVEAQLPQGRPAYFTSPSVVTLTPGSDARFSMSFAASRLSGVVQNDAGSPLAGVTVRAEGAMDTSTVTDSSGAYRFSTPAGVVRISLVPESLPAGHDLSQLTTQERSVTQDSPATADFSVRAQRAIQGTVSGAAARPVTITIPEIQRSAQVDATGQFTLRSLPAGALTLILRSDQRESRNVITLAPEPGVTRVQLAAP